MKPIHILDLIVAFLLAFVLCGAFLKSPPRVIVNMPADAKKLEELPAPSGDDKVLSGERAVLWWTVYHYTLEKGWGPTAAKDVASDAVRAAYPPR